ncbi:MAG TPA: hypothetical protein VKZ84_04440 [Bacteriovoracaceae bacterium]|nr:hypothetical protein [Bacteriovoracaceae bacterium]
MKTLTFLLFCLPFFAFATSTLEEGLILHEELRFLEETSKRSLDINVLGQRENIENDSNDLDLESTYFGQNTEDEIRTRTSAPRRRAP